MNLKNINTNQLDVSQRDIEDEYSLSPLQQGMLFHTLRDKGVGMYVSQAVSRHKDLNVKAYQKAWQTAVDNHSILRTSFNWDDPENPKQTVHKTVMIPFEVYDWREVPVAQQNSKLRQYQREVREQGFDLSKPCLLKVSVFQVTETRWYSVNSHHHIILDGWSGGLLGVEIARLYEAIRSGREILINQSRPFGDYIRWIEKQNLSKAKEFWQKHLKGIKEPTPLPADCGISEQRVRLHVESWSSKYNSEGSKQLDQLARNYKVTLNSIIQGVWALLLSKYSGELSILFGSLVSGRPPSLEGVESMVGMFLNAVPFRVNVSDSQRLCDWFSDLHREQVELQSYEYSPLMMIQQWSEIPAGTPLFYSIVARKDVTQAGKSGVSKKVNSVKGGKSEQSTFQQNYPMLLNIIASDGVELKMTYDARRFRKPDIARIMEQLRNLLQSMIDMPDQKVGNLSILSQMERNQVLYEWNSVQFSLENESSLQQIFEQQVRRCPDADSVSFLGKRLSFNQLNRLANQFSRHLVNNGVVQGSLVGIEIEHSLELSIVVLAILKLRGRCVPLAGLNLDDIKNLRINAQGLSVIVVQDRLMEKFSLFECPIICPTKETEIWHSLADTNPQVKCQASDIAAVLFKYDWNNELLAIELSHGLLLNSFNRDSSLHLGDIVSVNTPLHSQLFFWQLFSAWKDAAVVDFVPKFKTKRSENLLKHLVNVGSSRIMLTPTMLYEIIDDASGILTSLTNLKLVLCAGEPLTAHLKRLWIQRLPEIKLGNLYYNFEAGVVFVNQVDLSIDNEKIIFGNSVGDLLTYVLDKNLNPCPIGIVGGLYVGGKWIQNTYASSEKSSQQYFFPDLFVKGKQQKIVKTDDLARRLPDGSIEYVGKALVRDEQGAGKVVLHKIEDTLRKNPIIKQAAVIERGDLERIAFLVTQGQELDYEELSNFLIYELPRHSLPTHYALMGSLPLDDIGRIARKALVHSNVKTIDASIKVSVKAPETELEEIIAKVWMDVLKIDHVSISDNFFELGGHSLSATKTTARLTNVLKSDIPLKAIFEAPTIQSLAVWIQSGDHEDKLPYAIEIADRGSEAPLTYTQQQLWILNQLFPNMPMYTIPSNTLFTGRLDEEGLHVALISLVERHEVLRTVFVSRNGEPLQVVQPVPHEIPIKVADVSHFEPEQRMDEARRLGATLGKVAWDLEKGPLMRVMLVRLSETEFVLNTAFHHIIADGPSMAVFCAELTKFYDAYIQGKPPRLSKLPLQFADYAVWERENVRGELFEKQLHYWKDNLKGAELLEIPMDFPRPAVHGFFGKKVKFEIPEEVVSNLKKIGAQEGATIFMSILAVYQSLLHRYSGQEDVLVGSAMTNRIRIELERLIGLFVNTIPLRTNFSGNPTFREVLGRVRDCCTGAFSNMDLPFEETIAQIQPTRDLSRQGSPIFQFMLIHNPGGKGKRKFEEGKFRQGDPHIDTGRANFDLLLATRDTSDNLIKITLTYDTELFRQETIDRLISHFKLLFQTVAKNPDLPISEIQMASENELHDVLVAWNGKEVEPESRCVHNIIQQWILTQPQHPALVFEGNSINYDELNRRSNQVGRYLQKLGVVPDEFVGLCLYRGFNMIIGLLGILKAGAAFVPMDPAYPSERLRHILTDTCPPVVLTDHFFDQQLLQGLESTRYLDIEQREIYQESDEVLKSDVKLNNLAYVIYTSGSTGQPKGVMVEHVNLANIIRSQIKQFEIDKNSRVLQMLSLSFDASLGEIFRALVAGATLYLANKDDVLPGPGLVRILKEHKISVMAISPTALAAMPAISSELPDLLTITVGGESCNSSTAEYWGKGRRLLNGYGPTETTIGATLAVNWDFKAKPPLGRPLDGVKVYVLDKSMKPSPVGIPGELYIGGVGVARGYLNQEELTNKLFMNDPFDKKEGARMYRTGDLVRWLSNGTLDFLGRVDQQVKIRGFRIELGEIETALMSHDSIKQAAVSVHESKGLKRLMAYIVYKDVETPFAELRDFLKGILPEYMVPNLFLALPDLPLNNSGKVDRKALKNLEIPEVITETEYIEPKTEIEKFISQIWISVLGIKRIGLNDNFFELGGDSISAIRVVARINEFGIELTPKEIFANQTIADLAGNLSVKGVNPISLDRFAEKLSYN